jgi:hypothetical protein
VEDVGVDFGAIDIDGEAGLGAVVVPAHRAGGGEQGGEEALNARRIGVRTSVFGAARYGSQSESSAL